MITGPQVLAPDVVIVPAAELARGVRRNLRLGSAGSFAISRPGGRRPSKIVDARSARLLELFRTPRRIVDAVVELSRADGADPRATLAGAFPILSDCRDAGFLVAADSPDAVRILPMLNRGDSAGAWRVERCVQVLEDCELYQVSGPGGVAALKILRPGAGASPKLQLANEAGVLRHLAGRGAPRLLHDAPLGGRTALVLEWCAGVSPLVAAAELRGEDRRGLLRLCCDIAAAYAKLHARGVVHADVEPRNLLVDGSGNVTILDFGLAQRPGTRGRVPRAGISPLQDPAYARALLAGRTAPAATRAGDQYSLAALLYVLVTGELHLDISLETRRALRQIASDPPLPFARHRIAPWPGVERVLARALRKSPAARYPSMAAFVAALRAELRREPRKPARAGAAVGTRSPLDRIASRVRSQLDISGPAFAEPLAAPTASVKFGAAGIALACYRLASIEASAPLLAAADVWLARAERAAVADGERAFCNDDLGVPRAQVGAVTPYHTMSGVHFVRALVSQATGDIAGLDRAARSFAAASRARCDSLDLTLGRAGTLLATSMLLDAVPFGCAATALPLRRLGARRFGALWRALRTMPEIPRCTRFPALGIAHGWAGLLYASMRWCRSAGVAAPDGLARRLDELAACAEPAGRGVRWASAHRTSGGAPATGYVPGWCNGSAGLVHLWTLAFRVTGDARHLGLAEQSAWHAWEDREGGTSLCCGLAGRAYALINLYRHTGEKAWLDRARTLGDRAAREALARRAVPALARSLYKGDLGLLLLAADLERPEAAGMPMFEEEGWPKRPTT